MFDRFGEDARQVLVFAHDEARALEHGYVGTEHLLIGAIEQSAGIAGGLESLGVSLDDIISKIEENTDPERRRAKGPRPYTPRAKRTLDLSSSVAAKLGHDTVRPEHILLAALEIEDVAGNVLASLGAEPEAVQRVLLDLLERDPVPAPLAEADDVGVEAGAGPELVAADGEVVTAPAPRRAGEAGPKCPRCDADLLETIRWHQHVAPGPNDDQMMVYLLFCSQCGRTLEARSEE